MNLASCFRGSSSSSSSSNSRNSNQLSVESARGGRHPRRRAISSPDSGKTLALTPDDIKWIQRTWYGHEDSQDLAVRIFLQVFQTKPDLAVIFGLDPKEFLLSKSNGGETAAKKYLGANRRFMEHAKAFASFFELVIHEISNGSDSSNSEDLISMIRAMGTHHSTIPNLSFTAENFLLIKTKILETVCGRGLAPERLDKPCTAWCKLLMFLIAEMKDAYILGVNRKNTWPAGRHSFGGRHILSPAACSLLSTSDETNSSFASSSSGFCSNASSEEKLTVSDHHSSKTSPISPPLRHFSGDYQLRFADDYGSTTSKSAALCPFHQKQSSENGQASLKSSSDEIRGSSDSDLTLKATSSLIYSSNIDSDIEGLHSLKISTC